MEQQNYQYPGKRQKVWVNQGNRKAVCLAVIGDEALIEYEMPNGRTYLVVVWADQNLEKDEHYGLWRTVAKLPGKWERAVEGAAKGMKARAEAANAQRLKAQDIDAKIRANTGFADMADMLSAGGNYRPSLDMRQPVMVEIAEAYDAAQAARGDARRAYRYGVD